MVVVGHARDVSQLVVNLPNTDKFLGLSPNKPGMETQTCNPSTQHSEVEAGGLKVQGHGNSHSESHSSPGYMRPFREGEKKGGEEKRGEGRDRDLTQGDQPFFPGVSPTEGF